MKTLPAPRTSRKSFVKHRQDVVRQILLPILLITLLIVAVAVLVAVATAQGSKEITRWAATATIWMIIPLMAMMVVLLVSSWGVVYLLTRLLQRAPHYTGIAQQYALRFNEQIVLWTDRIIQPILKFQAWVKIFSREE